MATPTDGVPVGGALPAEPAPPFSRKQRRQSVDPTAPYAALARPFAVLLGVVALVWGCVTLPVLWRQLPIEHTADAVINGDAFRPHTFDPLLPVIEQIEQADYCRPSALHWAAIIRLRLVEDAIAAGAHDQIDARLGALDSTIHRALACNPTDSFFWMVLTWVEGVREGPRQDQLTYLRLSYQLGPNEGWIADRRNRLALSMFNRLPPDLAGAAVDEFGHMVQSWIYLDTIAIFTGPGWPIRGRLLASLKDVGQAQRDAFARALYQKGYNVDVPGVAPRSARPWD
jgi:hypothetical protein